MRVRCGNMEEDNKYWLDREKRTCVFCRKGKDNWKHFVEECTITKEWFEKLGGNKGEKMRRIWNEELNVKKREILKKFWKEKIAVERRGE